MRNQRCNQAAKGKRGTSAAMRLKVVVIALVIISGGRAGGSAGVGQQETGSERTVELVAQLGHSGNVESVAFSADSQYLVTGGGDDTAKLWEVASRRELRTFHGHTSWVISVALSSDGKYLVTGSLDNTAKLWEVESGRELRTFKGHSDPVRSIALSGDDKYLVTGSNDKTAKLWEVASGKELRTFTGHSDKLNSVALSHDGKYLATGSWDNKAKLWDVESGSELRTFTGHSDSVTSVVLSRDGKYLVTGGGDDTAKLWEAASGRELRTFKGHSKGVYSVALSSDGKYLAAGSRDKTAKLWEVESGRELRTFTGHLNNISPVAFSPDGKYLASGGDGQLAEIWEVASGKELFPFSGYSRPVLSVALSADGKYLVTGNYDNEPKLWDVESGSQIRTFKGHIHYIWSVALSNDGRYLATGSTDHTARLWDLASGRELDSLTGHPHYVWAVAFSSDSKYLVTGSWDKTAKLWEVANGRELRTFTGHSEFVKSIALSSDGKYLATGSDDKTAKLWDVSSGRELRTFKGHSASVVSVALSNDGKYLVTGSYDHTAKLWETVSGRELRSFQGHSDHVSSIALCADGKYLVTGSDDRTAKLWETASGRELRSFQGHFDGVESVTLSKDSKYLITGGGDGTTRIWNLQDGREICRLISFLDGNWAVAAPDGRFDVSNLEAVYGLYWMMSDEPMRTYPIEIFMRDYYEPRLLPRLLSGEQFKPIQSIATLNRVQPEVTLVGSRQTGNPALVSIVVKVSKGSGEFKQGDKKITRATGVYDLRLFRDGQLVAQLPQFNPATNDASNQANIPPEEMRKAWRKGAQIKLEANGEQIIEFKNIYLPRRADTTQVEFAAYAFNEDRVKSQTDRKIFNLPKNLTPVKGRAYVITVGINTYENRAWNLRFAANDARLAQQALSKGLKQSGEFTEVVSISLISDAQQVADAKSATKANFKAALEEIARRARPEDLVMIYYASHGYADKNGNYYFFTTDTRPGNEKAITPELLRHLVSSDELSAWLKDVDAGEMALIIDACQSAGTVKGEAGGEFKPGPMGSRGLGQLAYDKGMRILAASQADDFAFELDELQHGLLTYALMKNGVEGRKADLNEDGQVMLSEAFSYALERVPKLYEAMQKGELVKLFKAEGDRGPQVVGEAASLRRKNRFQRPSLFDFTKKGREIVLAR